MKLRYWQQEAFETYRRLAADGARSLLWEATPGAGKTAAALHLCRHELDSRRRKRVVIVVPTAHLKSQWAAAATPYDIHLDTDFRPQVSLSADFNGVVTTYQQLAGSPRHFQTLCRGAVVVLDEIHHAGDGLAWGEALRQAVEPAGFILCLSGTAFRSDNAAIPFIDYNQEGESRPDYSYNYTRAIEDGVCRPTAFFTYGGEVAWMEAGQTIETNFNDELFGPLAARRLRVALEPESGWVKPMLVEAQQMLRETRLEHPQAGGLVVAADQNHARQLADLLFEITGRRPAVALSDDSDASRKIKRFARSQEEWIVACNMVSEGVDIPRLRVGVYATTITTRMYFRQFLGRMVRVTSRPFGVQVAYVYLPADPRLRLLAQEIELEQRHFLRRIGERAWELAERPSESPPAGEPAWSALNSYNSGLEAVIVNGQQLALFSDPSLLPQGPSVRQQIHQKVEERVLPLSRAENKALLAQKIRELVTRLHHKNGLPYREIHALLNRQQGVRSQKVLTEKQLEQRRQLLLRMLA